MDTIKRFIDCYIDTKVCNLKCHYCYISLLNGFGKNLVEFPYPPEKIAEALSKKRMGGICLLNFCAGGETLLAAHVIPVIKALLEEGHYLMVVTNGTISERFDEIAAFPKELLDRLMFKFSFHYLELQRLGWMDRFFRNIYLMQESGASFTVEITPSDELIPHIEDVKRVCIEKLGALCHVTIARDDRTDGIDVLSHKSWEEYKKLWGQFDSELFDFKTSIFYKKRTEFCYAGDWVAYLNLTTGSLSPCNCGQKIDNIYRDIHAPIHFEAIGQNCELPHCYNGHVWLTLGAIPELNTVTYDTVRNRAGNHGEWLKPEVKEFLSHKLVENNKEYSSERKNKINKRHRFVAVKRRIRRYIGKKKRDLNKLIKG